MVVLAAALLLHHLWVLMLQQAKKNESSLCDDSSCSSTKNKVQRSKILLEGGYPSEDDYRVGYYSYVDRVEGGGDEDS